MMCEMKGRERERGRGGKHMQKGPRSDLKPDLVGITGKNRADPVQPSGAEHR